MQFREVNFEYHLFRFGGDKGKEISDVEIGHVIWAATFRRVRHQREIGVECWVG